MMSWKERVFRSLPFVLVLVSAAGVAITEEIWAAIIGLVGMWLLPSPIPSSDRSGAWPDVSRETSVDTVPTNVSRETMTVPCVVMHGSAEPHVMGCEGWRWPPE